MGEKKQIISIFFISILLLFGGLIWLALYPLDNYPYLSADSYSADFDPDLTLHEQFLFNVSEENTFHYLYRSFDAPLSTGSLQIPYIQYLSGTSPKESVSYLKDWDGTIFFPDDTASSDIKKEISKNAENSEFGGYRRSYYPVGLYTLNLTTQWYPPVEYDDQWYHLNLLLASEHVPYESLWVTFPEHGVGAIYPHPARLLVTKENDQYVVTGSVRGNEILGLEILMYPEAGKNLPGFFTFVSDIHEKTINTNTENYDLSHLRIILDFFGILAALFTPLILLLSYLIFGREKKVLVPQFLSTIPNPSRKPWQVNHLFSGDPIAGNEHALFATILDLARKKMIRMKQEESGIRFEVLSEITEDPYEKETVSFLQYLIMNGYGNTETLTMALKNRNMDSSTRKIVKELQKRVVHLGTYSDPCLIRTSFKTGRIKLLALVLYGLLMMTLSFITIATPKWNPNALTSESLSFVLMAILTAAVFIYFAVSQRKAFQRYHGRKLGSMFISVCVGVALISLIAFLNAIFSFADDITSLVMWSVFTFSFIVAYFFPASLFGKWKGDLYKEKQEWDAFKAFLSDRAQISTYQSVDLGMWGEWLVMGTALGIGQKVAHEMKELEIDLPDYGIMPLIAIGGASSLYTPLQSYSSYRGSGGGFGGRGGFGGGGGGGR